MAKYDPTHPALCLRGKISGNPIAIETYSDIDNSGLTGQDIAYQFVINSIQQQAISDESTRQKGIYNGIDIKAGDWLSDGTGEIILQIKNVIFKSATSIEIVAKDVDGLTFRQYSLNKPSADSDICVFELTENGLPVLLGDAISMFADRAIDKIQSRFSIDEDDERFRFYHNSPNTTLPGEIVTIDDNGVIVKHGSVGASSTPVGTVVSKSHNNKIVYVKPFNKIIDNYADPSVLTGSPGDTYYTDPSDPGKIKTTKSPGSKPVYLHLVDAIPTIITSTSATTIPGNNDVIRINNFTVFDGPSGHSVSNTVDLRDLINAQTTITKVEASADVAAAFVNTADSLLHPGFSACVALLENTAAGITQYPSISISDGDTTINITFDPTGYGINTQLFFGIFNIIVAEDIAQILNTEFSSNGLNLTASVVSGTNAQYNNLRIDHSIPGKDITITNITSDVINTQFASVNGGQSISGLVDNTVAGGDAFLELKRLDGGDILITGGTSLDGTSTNLNDGIGYINSNGICSSSSGRASVIMMIEGSSEGATVDTGVTVSADKDMSPLASNGDNSDTGLTITHTPFMGSMVSIRVNGLEANLGDNVNYSTKDCYFKEPGAPIIRAYDAIEAGDEFYWNGDTSNFQLDSSDDIDFIYQTSSSNT